MAQGKSGPVVVLINCDQAVIDRLDDPFIKLLFGVSVQTISIKLDKEEFKEIFGKYDGGSLQEAREKGLDHLLRAYGEAAPQKVNRRRVQVVMVEETTRLFHEAITDLFPKAVVRFANGKEISYAPRGSFDSAGMGDCCH